MQQSMQKPMKSIWRAGGINETNDTNAGRAGGPNETNAERAGGTNATNETNAANASPHNLIIVKGCTPPNIKNKHT